MGYLARYTGRIMFDPPAPRQLVKDSPSAPGRNFASDVRLVIEVYEVETDAGLKLRERAIAVEPASTSGFKGYDMQNDLQAVLDLLNDGERVFTGHIDAVGEDGDRWRFKITDGAVRRFEPTITWPPESE